jgi:hypothetical protein
MLRWILALSGLALPGNENFLYQAGQPLQFPEEVICVLAYKRASSLSRVLDSARGADYLGATVELRIWIDWSSPSPDRDEVIKVALEYDWPYGRKIVRAVDSPALGLVGQWVEMCGIFDEGPSAIAGAVTQEQYQEVAQGLLPMILILHDDVSLSPLHFKWAQAAKKVYWKRPDIFGMTLESDRIVSDGYRAGQYFGSVFGLDGKPIGSSFFYRMCGTHGFMTKPVVWRKFRSWYERWDHEKHAPLYTKTVITTYAIKQADVGRQPFRNMPEIWTTQFTEEMGGMWTVYANPVKCKNWTSAEQCCLLLHHREDGLHFNRSEEQVKSLYDCELLQEPTEDFFDIRRHPYMLDFDLQPIIFSDGSLDGSHAA